MNEQTRAHPFPPSLRRGWWIALLAAVLIAGGVRALTHRSSENPAEKTPGPGATARAVPVTVATAKASDVPEVLDGIGAVTPLASVTVRSRVDGQLMAVHFREGDTVRAGDLLAEIDPRPFQVQLAQAEGQMARDRALLANGNVDLARYKKLVAQDSLPKQQLDTQAALVLQYEAAVKVDQGQIDAAKLQLDYARIVAPIDGRLGLRLVDPGNMVHSSDAGGLVVITQIRPIAVVFTLPEDRLPPVLERLRAGEKLPVEAYDRAGKKKLADGTLLTVDNEIDPSTGTVRLKAEFTNDDDALFPNQFVNARLQVALHRDVTVVPSAAVRHGARGTYVYAVKDGKTAELRTVEVGLVNGDRTSIESGLEAGTPVVVEGAEALRDGSPVAVQTRDGAGATPAKDSS